MHKKNRGLAFCINFCKLNARAKKDFYLIPQIQEAIENLVGAGCFSCLDLKVGFWQVAMDEVSKQYTTFTVGNLGFFECKCMPLGLCYATATFQGLMQNCLGELYLKYCLIYLVDVIVFSKKEEEHLECLHVVFNHFQEHNLMLKCTKCEFFQDEINYLAHHVYKEGMQSSKENLIALAEFSPSQTNMEIQAFLGLLGHYRQFIKGYAHTAQPLHEQLVWGGAHKKRKQVTLMVEAKDAFETLKKACLKAPVLASSYSNKPFLLETNTNKLGLGAVLSKTQTDGWCHPVAYASQSLTTHECNYHSMKQEFLALKWTVAKQFQEYLLWKPFIVKTEDNSLTYIMTAPNVDATQNQWLESLARFTFSIEYQKGRDNAATDALSWVTVKLDTEIVKSILDGVTMGMTKRADAQDPVVAKADEDVPKLVQEIAVLARAAKHV